MPVWSIVKYGGGGDGWGGIERQTIRRPLVRISKAEFLGVCERVEESETNTEEQGKKTTMDTRQF